MIITCNKQVLLNNINIVMKSVATRTTMPILECILIVADRDGLRLIANDLELGIETANISAEIIELGSVALKANIFADIVRNMPSEDVTINVDHNYFATITGNKTEFTIAGQHGDEFPQINKIQKDNKYTIKSRVFSNMIKQTKFSVSLDETKPILTGELLEIKNEQFNIVAADYSRVSFRKSFVELEHNQDLNHMDVVVPARTLTEIIKILPDKGDDLLNIYFNENHVLFEIESCIIVSRLLEGDFLKYEPIFTEDHTTKIKISKLELLDSLKRAVLVTRDSKKTVVKLDINSDETLIITASAELGNSKEELRVDLQGAPLSISFNTKYLIDALRVIDDEMIFIQFMSPLSPCIIKPVETDEFKYLILPLKV
ncbi:MAG: DNA polymerase III subunit beta [bacterium]